MPVNSVRPRKAPEARQRSAASVPSTVARRRRNQRRPEGDPGRVQQRLVVKQGAVPAGREAAPDGDEPRRVEGKEHQEHDRQVEEGEAERQDGELKRREARVIDPLLLSSAPLVPVERDRPDQQHEQDDRHGGRQRPVAVVEEFVPELRPIMSVSEPPSRSGMTNSPTAGMKTQQATRRQRPAAQAAP